MMAADKPARTVSKISSCRVHAVSRWGTEQPRSSFGLILLLFLTKIARVTLIGQVARGNPRPPSLSDSPAAWQALKGKGRGDLGGREREGHVKRGIFPSPYTPKITPFHSPFKAYHAGQQGRHSRWKRKQKSETSITFSYMHLYLPFFYTN